MILASEYKDIKRLFKEKIRALLKNNFYSDIKYYESPPSYCMQYWKIELSYFYDCESLEGIDSILGYFSVNDIDNMKISINDFFKMTISLLKNFFKYIDLVILIF